MGVLVKTWHNLQKKKKFWKYLSLILKYFSISIKLVPLWSLIVLHVGNLWKHKFLVIAETSQIHCFR